MNVAHKKIKVAFVLPALTAGGAERVLITLMNNLDRDRFEPEFITVSNTGPLGALIADDIPFHSLDRSRVTRAIPKLFLQLKKIKPDVVISTMTHMNLCLLVLKPFFPMTGFIVREAITPSFIMDEHKDKLFILKTAYKLLYPLAKFVISPAQAIIDEFKRDIGLSGHNHVLLRNPVDMDRIRAEEKTPFEVKPERKKTVHFIAAGRLNHQKGFDRLINALPGLEMPYDWRLTILGEGDERENLKDLIVQTGLQDKIRLPGLSEHPWPEYAKADCFVMPSRWEGLPNVVLESLACGTPVIATKESGGIAEIADLADGSVTVVNDMNEFIAAMQNVVPTAPQSFRASLLPAEYKTKTIVAQLEEIITKSA